MGESTCAFAEPPGWLPSTQSTVTPVPGDLKPFCSPGGTTHTGTYTYLLALMYIKYFSDISFMLRVLCVIVLLIVCSRETQQSMDYQ